MHHKSLPLIKITLFPFQNIHTSHTQSKAIHTKNQAQPCHKPPIISTHHFMQSQYRTITPRSNHMNSLSKYAPIKTYIKLHSNTHSFMKNQPKSTQSTQNFSHQSNSSTAKIICTFHIKDTEITHTNTIRTISAQLGISHIKIHLMRLKLIK